MGRKTHKQRDGECAGRSLGITQEPEPGRVSSEHGGSLQQLVKGRGISQEALNVSRRVRAARG